MLAAPSCPTPAAPWTVAHQVPLSTARILEWVAISSSRNLPHPGIEPGSSSLQADSLPSESTGKTLLIEKKLLGQGMQNIGYSTCPQEFIV